MRKISLPLDTSQYLNFSLILLFLFVGSACAQTESEVVQITTITKIVHEEYRLEKVRIGSEEYVVPPLWQGKKIEPLADISSSLSLVSPQFVKNNGKIYLHTDTRDAFVLMAEQAEEDGIHLLIDSGYRSVWYQKKIFKRQMEKGKSFAEIARFVAPPGYSEHVLGRAADFSPSNWRFADTDAYRWLGENAGNYGFVETYPENNPNGEPWEASHWCYHPPSKPLLKEMQ